jgi:hypothetical protein
VITAVRPITGGASGGLANANWLFECACLSAALAAVHASVPVQCIVLT